MLCWRTVHIHDGAALHCAHANAELQYNQRQPALSAWIGACAAGSLPLQDCVWKQSIMYGTTALQVYIMDVVSVPFGILESIW
jgi:hypothetical protein